MFTLTISICIASRSSCRYVSIWDLLESASKYAVVNLLILSHPVFGVAVALTKPLSRMILAVNFSNALRREVRNAYLPERTALHGIAF